MLQQGGNAIDAAVATAAALNVVEPYMSGLGGVGYMTIRTPQESRPIVLDYMGYALAGADLERFQAEASLSDGILSSILPGAVSGWLTALERFGTMDRAAVFAPAIDYAENGFPLTVKNGWFFSTSEERLSKWSTSRETYLPNGRAPKPGEIFRQPNLARTYHAIVEGGADAFYRGPIGQTIAEFAQANGGLLTAEELAAYQAEWQSPISIDYGDYTVYCPAPPCSGIEYLQTLKIVEPLGLGTLDHNSAKYIHSLAEAMKLSLADRTAYAAAPSPPTDQLLSTEYAAERRKLIDASKAGYSGGERYTSIKAPGEILPGSVEAIMRECTTHLVTVDDAGNAVACTQSLGSGFGSAVVYGDTGVAMNNIANWFDRDPESPNVIGPNKKIEMPMSPSQIWRDDSLFMMVGTPGSYGIMQTTPQMILNVLEHGFSIQAAIEAPRFRTMEGTGLMIERRVPDSVIAELRERGHEVQLLDSWTPMVGGGQGILVDPDSGAFFAGADPRRDGYALAY
jgi:gamma-glutamyltranspeptidase / glutathione hydrolase